MLLALGATPLWFLPGTLDPTSLPKATLLLSLGVVAGAVSLVRAVHLGLMEVPWHPAAAAVAVVALLIIVASASSDLRWLSLFGTDSYHSGALLYLAVMVLWLVTLRAFPRSTVTTILGVVVAASAIMGGYALVQAAGLDPIAWGESVAATATVGNPNFVAGHLAVGVAAGAGLAALPQLVRRRRVLAGVGAGLCAAALPAAASDQGWLASAAGLGVLAYGAAGRLPERYARVVRGGVVAGAVVGVASVMWGVRGGGPLSFLADKFSTVLRLADYRAAVAIAADHPGLGVGFDRFMDQYPAYRPLSGAMVQPLDSVTEAPHSVPLDLFVSGGVALGGAYLVYLGVVAVVLVRGLHRRDGEVALVAAAGAAWVAAQAQSVVSIDVPSLLATHWLLGAVVLLSAGEVPSRTIELPWGPPSGRSPRRSGMGWRRGASLGVVVLTLAALGVAQVPLRASILAVQGQDAADIDTATARLERAGQLAFWESRYPFELGRALRDAEQHDRAVAAYEEAVRRHPRHLIRVRALAHAYLRAERPEEALGAAERALELDGQQPTLLAEVAWFRLRAGEFDAGIDLLERAVAVDPDLEVGWQLLLEAYEVVGDGQAAQEARRHVARLEGN